ncbi:DUF2785 domain-containing protein [Periweissella cryptocerci]|nr:DUF2785 domain-containing protein [Periweissella cryptocerci]
MLTEQIEAVLASTNPVSDDLLAQMLANIGNPNPKLRDEVIFNAWGELISNNRLTDEQLHALFLQIYQDQRLFIGIGGEESDAVFTRSFTALLLMLLVYRHFENPWLNDSEAELLAEMALDYLNQETDKRGFVTDKGWAHAFAHGSDFLASVVALPSFDEQKVGRALAALDRALLEFGPFTAGEEGRLDNILIKLMGEDWLLEDELLQWLDGLLEQVQGDFTKEEAISAFLRSFVFKTDFEGLASQEFNQRVNAFLEDRYKRTGGL